MTKRKKTTPEMNMNLNVKVLMMLVLSQVESFSMGVLTALLPKSVPLPTLELRKRGAMVLLSLPDDQVETWDGASPLALSILVLWRGDAKAPSAGEIQASILEGLTASPVFCRDGYDIVAKHLKNEHVSFTPSIIEGAAGVDLHRSSFELVMVKTAAKDAADSMAAQEA